MTRIMDSIIAQPWAMEPGELRLLVEIAQRNHNAPDVKERENWTARDFTAFCGPNARRLEGTRYAMISDAGVALLPVYGAIFPRANMVTEYSGGTSLSLLQNDYRIALNHPDVGACLFVGDSGGGAVGGVNAMADTINAGKAKKYTAAHVSGTCASACYWMLSQCNEITLERTAMVGSIGVACVVPKQVQHDQHGYVDVEIVSTNAPNKWPDPSTESGKATIVARLDAIEAQFLADVARGRGVSVETVKEKFGQGDVFLGADAIKRGMADRIESYEATFSRLARMVATQRRTKALQG